MAKIDGTASVEIEAPIERVWELLEDVERSPEWQGGLRRFDGVEHDERGRAVLCRSESDAKIRTVSALVRIHYEGPHRLRWRQERGDLKSAAGSWQLEPLGDMRTRATYAIQAEVSGLLGAALRGPVRDLLVATVPAELKRAVEETG